MSSIEIVQPSTASNSEQGPPTSLRSLLRYWPIAVFFSLAMILNPVFFIVLDGIQSPYLQFVFYGLIFGELVLVGLIGGLFGRHWLVGYLFGLLVALAGLMVIWHVTDFRMSAYRKLPWFWRACHVPATLLVASLPLLALRNFRHWRISHSSASKSPLRLEDIFLVTSIVGCVIVLMVAPTKLSEALAKLAGRFDSVFDPSRLIADELVFAGWGALCLLVTAPMAFLILDRNERLSQRLGQALMHSTAAIALGVLVIYLLSGEFGAIPQFAIGFCVSYVVVLIGLICFRASGFELHGRYGRSLHLTRTLAVSHHETTSQHEPAANLASPSLPLKPTGVADEPQQGQGLVTPATIWLPRITTITLLGFAIYVSIVAQSSQQAAKRAVQRFSEVKADFRARGGAIDGSTHRTASALILGPEMGDEDLQKIAECQYLDSICFAGSQVTDQGAKLISGFQTLRDIDLSNTAVTDATLDQIMQVHGRLRYVNLSNTQVTMAGVARFAKAVRTLQLNLSDNGFTDEDFANFEGNPRMIINVQGNPITAASLPKLTQFRGLGLGRNNLGTQWVDTLSRVPEVLLLDGSDIDDATCAALAKKTDFIDRLQIENTAITDAGIASLRNVAMNTLELGPGQITDAGLVKSGIKIAYQLRLSGPFTGICLKDWKLDTLEAIDLSHSQIDDDTLSSLPIPPTLRRLAICNTRVTDVGVHKLVNYPLEIVSIANTKITDSLLLRSSFRMVVVEVDRFSIPQIQLAQRRNVIISPVVQEIRLLDDQRQENRAPMLQGASRAIE